MDPCGPAQWPGQPRPRRHRAQGRGRRHRDPRRRQGLRRPCRTRQQTNICDGAPGTPVFSRDPVPAIYHVTIAQDVNFTTSEMPDGIDTTFPMIALEYDDERRTLPRAKPGPPTTGTSRPAGAHARCPPSRAPHPCLVRRRSARPHRPLAVSRRAAPTRARSRSTGRTTATQRGHCLAWGAGQPERQDVPDPGVPRPLFATLTDTRIVDQATYTDFDDLYPDGTYYWRVQALDARNSG